MPRWIFLLLLFVMAALCLYAQKKPADNTLLWRIKGNNLSKPSYLYGTIHVQDKRVFNFSDSLYSFLQSADGYAMEIHPDSVVLAIMDMVNKSATNDYVKKYLKKDEYDELNVKVRKELGIDADKLTIRQTYMLRQRLAKPERQPDDMPTMVDTYLYGMAKNQGKEIAGLERAIDQMNLLNEMRAEDFDASRILKNLKKDQTVIEKLIQLYIKEDLKGIGELMSILPDKTEDKLLNLRNHFMVEKMDSMMQLKSFVVAVGTAHLPGEQGMITLLRKKGYTVEPVYTTSRTHANKYAIKAQERNEWIEVKEPSLGYTARMPGKPSPMDMLNGVMKMNMYIDMTSMKQYYTAFVVPAINITNRNADSILQGMYKGMVRASMGEAISDKRFTRGSFEALDMVYSIPAENTYARVQSFAFGKRVYMIGMGARKKEELYAKDARDYFDAFTIEKMPEQEWQLHEIREHFFSISLPEPPKVQELDNSDSSFMAVQYNSLDKSRGNFYGVMIVTAAPGYVMPDDSLYYVNASQRITSSMKVSNVREKDTMVHGFRARWITADLMDRSLLKCLYINRGNRVYSLMVTGVQEDSNNVHLANFFSSISFIEYPGVKWKDKQIPEHGFTVPVTNDFGKTRFLDYKPDSVIADREYMWTAFDSTSATSFTVTRRAISPYFWTKHDSLFLKKYMNDFVKADDEIRGDYQFIKNGNSNGIAFTVSKRNSMLLQHIRVLLNGKSLFVLQAEAPHQYWKQYDFQQFFTGFRFIKEEPVGYLYANSFERLLKDLHSTDSATYRAAFEAINEVVYEPADMPVMLKALSDKYPLDTLEYLSVSDQFLIEIGRLEHDDFEKLVSDHYQSLGPEKEKVKFGILSLLAKKNTEKSYARIGELLSRPLPKDATGLYMFIYALYDSVELAKKLYPQLLALSSDSVMGTALSVVHARMLDSSLLSIDELKQQEAAILKSARNALSAMARERDEYYYAIGQSDLIVILARLKSDASIAMLREFLKSRFTSVKLDATLALLKIKQAVDPSVLLSIAADRGYRLRLYEDLRELRMGKAFPAKYLNQRSFAEGYMAQAMEDEEHAMTFIGERIAYIKGERKKFYLFKVTLDYDDKPSYLCVGGPFSLDASEILLKGEEDITGICDEEFRQSAIDAHFKQYLARLEKEVLSPGLPDEEDN